MTLFQLSSFSKDVYHLSLGIFVFNESLKFVIYKKENKFKNIIFILALLLFILSRPQYFAFALLSLLIPFKKSRRLKIKFRSQLILLLVLVSSVLGLLWYLFNNQVYLSPHNQVTSIGYSNQIEPQTQLVAIVTRPLLLPKAIASGFFHYYNFYFNSMVGIFGWVDKPLPKIIYWLFSF